MHAPSHTVDAPKIDEDEDSVVAEFIDKYIMCDKIPGNKKWVACRFNASWVPSDKTRTVCSEEMIDETIVKQSKRPIEKVFFCIVVIVLEDFGVTVEQYDNASKCEEKKVSALYKRKSCEVNIGQYWHIILLF